MKERKTVSYKIRYADTRTQAGLICSFNAVVFNLFARAGPQGNILLDRGPHAHISAQENEKALSIIAFVFLLAEPLGV